MKHIVVLGLFDVSENFQKTFSFGGLEFKIESFGTSGDVKMLKELVKEHEGNCDVICLSNLPHSLKIDGRIYSHDLVEEIKSYSTLTPIVDGQVLRDIYFPWAIRRLNNENPELLKNKKIGFFGGFVQYNFLSVINDFSDRLLFADPYLLLGATKILKSVTSLERFLKISSPVLKKKLRVSTFKRDFTKNKMKRNILLQDFLSCDIYFCSKTQFDFIETDILSGKIVITDFMTKSNEEKLKKMGVRNVITCFPNIESLPFHGFDILEAVFMLLKEKVSQLENDEIFDIIKEHGLSPKFSNLNLSPQEKEKIKFGFVIHPLSKNYYFKAPILNKLKNVKSVATVAEQLAVLAPGIKYGSIRGIASEASGVEVECEIYTVFETPKMMLKKDKSHMYDKLVKLAYKAEENGCKLMGLGAYTKIVGDAGVTVNKRSPLPITTGNSLSSAATLWAADLALKRMDLVKAENNIYQGTLMIVGATGSIGKVSAKILCRSWQSIIIVAPKEDKLMDLREELSEICSTCDIRLTTKANKFIEECDLIITTTSAQGKKIIDISKVKPGCVICDVSRPFDIPKSDAITRPDVLVIASGEVELPGNIRINRDLGLQGTTVYACLAETAILALEGRFEPFSISRELDYKKVIEIDKLARKHGIELSAIMGHDSEITPHEMELCRELAIEKRT